MGVCVCSWYMIGVCRCSGMLKCLCCIVVFIVV